MSPAPRELKRAVYPPHPEQWHRYQHRYSTATVKARLLPPDHWFMVGERDGREQKMTDACFGDRYDWIPDPPSTA